MKQKIKVNSGVAVIGSGLAAAQSAKMLAKLGHKVELICRDNLKCYPSLYSYLDGSAENSENMVRQTANELYEMNGQSLVTFRPNTLVSDIDGQIGDFTVTFKGAENVEEVKVGAVVFATDSSYKGEGGVVSGIFKSAEMASQRRASGRIAVILDSKGQESVEGCAAGFAIAEAFACKNNRVTLFCESLRVAACGLEEFYRRVRQAGVVVVKSQKPAGVVVNGKTATVSAIDDVTGANMISEFDFVVNVDEDVTLGKELQSVIEGLRTSDEGVLQDDNIWLLASRANRPGVFVVGSVAGRGEFRQAMSDALTAAAAVHETLGDGVIEIENDAAVVDSDKCVLCLTCKRVCPHGAIDIDNEKKAAKISLLACQRCGICTVECPVRAIELPGYTDDDLSGETASNSCVVFACENSAIPAYEQLSKKPEAKLVRVPCAGKVDSRMVVEALASGAQKVLVLGCHPESCKYISGSSRAQARMKKIGDAIEKAGFDRSRVAFRGLASVEPGRVVEYLNEMIGQI